MTSPMVFQEGVAEWKRDEDIVTEVMDIWGLTKQGRLVDFFGTLVLPRLRSGIMKVKKRELEES